jgi:Na+-transporting NADH:ubiquinone oxidoreductase subunit NqrE
MEHLLSLFVRAVFIENMALAGILLMARAWLVNSGDVNISINGERTVTVPVGLRLQEHRKK